MSLNLADILARARASDQVYNPIDAEIMAEKASSLGHHGRRVEAALAALRAHDADGRVDDEGRLSLVRTAAREVWAFLVQRELCGLRDQREIVRFYGIPHEVMVRLGVVEKR